MSSAHPGADGGVVEGTPVHGPQLHGALPQDPRRASEEAEMMREPLLAGLTIHEPDQPQAQTPLAPPEAPQPEAVAQQQPLLPPQPFPTWGYQPALPQTTTGYWATPGMPMVYPQMPMQPIPMQPIPSASPASTHPAEREDVGLFWANQRPLWAFWAVFSFINFLFFLLLDIGTNGAFFFAELASVLALVPAILNIVPKWGGSFYRDINTRVKATTALAWVSMGLNAFVFFVLSALFLLIAAAGCTEDQCPDSMPRSGSLVVPAILLDLFFGAFLVGHTWLSWKVVKVCQSARRIMDPVSHGMYV